MVRYSQIHKLLKGGLQKHKPLEIRDLTVGFSITSNKSVKRLDDRKKPVDPGSIYPFSLEKKSGKLSQKKLIYKRGRRLKKFEQERRIF